MTTLADQLAQALALVSTGALDEDYSKIATAAAVAEQPSETPSPSSLRRAGLLGCGGFASVWLVVEEPSATPLDSMCAAAAARVPPRGYRPTTPGPTSSPTRRPSSSRGCALIPSSRGAPACSVCPGRSYV